MAAEFGPSAAISAGRNLVAEYVSSHVSYFFHFGNVVEEFKNQRKQLELKNEQVKNDVDEAIRQTMVIEMYVQDWLKEADKELEDAQRLEAEIELKKCFSWRPHWGRRYRLSKKVAKKASYINKLLQRCDFQRVGSYPLLQGIEFFPSKEFKVSKSSHLAFNGIMSALNTNGVNMIGLYGMGGSGKTTLAKEVEKQVKEQKLFDDVVMVTWSQHPNISNIQDEIAGSLGLKFEASSHEGKAEELWRRLKAVKKILIIIDDVWNQFNLQTTGIPVGVHKGCKILLTTRSQEVCVQMNCQEKFPLNVLSEDEAWALFKDIAGLKDTTSAVTDVAKKVASDCKGLPLAIVTIGKALNGATLEEWKAANQQLKGPRHLDNNAREDIYKCILVSYNYLKGDDVRSCFLLCSLFPEDFRINIELLIVFVIGNGLFSHIDSIESLRKEIHRALRKLQEACLLLETGDGDDGFDDSNEAYVSMHDVIRDFAHWITSGGETVFMIKEGLTEWPINESFGHYTSIAFWDSNINRFPDKLEFSKLKSFVFRGKNNLVRIPSAFVKGMKALQVLHLGNVIFSLEVFKFLKNLRTLYFEDCELENVSSLGSLENLEILALLGTNIYELPEELVRLQRLKSLHFSYSEYQQNNFPSNLLSRLTSLQELHVTCANNVNLSELNSLSRLTALSLRVSTSQCFQENFVFPELLTFMIAVNEDNLGYMQGLKFRTLKIKDFSSSLSPFKELFKNVEKLTLENVKHKNVVPDVDQKGLNELISLHLECCKGVECLVDTTIEKGPTSAFSNLKKLKVKYIPCLKELCHGPPPIKFLQELKDVAITECKQLKVVFQMDGLVVEDEQISQIIPLFSNLTSLHLSVLPELESIWLQSTHQCHASLQHLKVVTIRYCHELKSIFPTCVVQSLLHLERLTISYCEELEQVFDFPQEMIEVEENWASLLSNLTDLKLQCLQNLMWIWKRPTHLVRLQSLKSMSIHRCSKLTYLFPSLLAQSLEHLEELKIWSCHTLEHVVREESQNEDEIVPNMNGNPFLYPKLRILHIFDCGSLKYVFPITSAQELSNLEFIEITDCSQLKQVFNVKKEQDGSGQQDTLLQKLQILRLENLENLCSFCPENFVMSLSLKEFKVRNCPRLTRFGNQQGVPLHAEFEDVPLYGFEKLFCNAKKLTLKHSKELESLFLFDTIDMKENQAPLLSNLTSLKLETLPDLKWIWKGPTHYVSFRSLMVAEISRCDNLKYLFSQSLARSLVLLEQLKINDCSGLKHIITELEIGDSIESDDGHLHPPLFPKLASLEIHCCPRLKYVFQIPLAQGLPHLISLSITNAPQLKQVFNVAMINYGVDRSAFELPCLQHLQLENLINLSCFCSENYPILSSSLEKLIVLDCPQLPNFIIQQEDNKHLQLKELWLSELEHNQIGHFLSRIEIISLKLIHQLQGPIQGASFQYLRGLRVSKCNRLKSLFSSMLARNFPQLKYLHIKCCEELEEIIEMDQTSMASSSQDQLQPISFPSLECVCIYGCGNLKSVFPINVTHSLSNLKDIEISGASKLEQGFYQGHDLNVEDNQKGIVFPKLRGFKLFKLPSLKSFLPMGYHFQFPSLGCFEVTGCPKLITKFNIDSKCVMHAIAEVSSLIPRKEIVDYNYTFNDIYWCREDLKGEIPIYLHAGETALMLHKDVNFLHIKCCGELGPILEKSQSSMFPLSQYKLKPSYSRTLERIWMYGCNNLKILFSIDIICSLSNLKSIKIGGASKLEQVFGYRGSTYDIENDQKEMVFPALKDLKLSKLPSLNSFAPTGYSVQFPSLSRLKVIECPKLTTSFGHSDLGVHAITKELHHAQNINTVEEKVDNQSTCNDIIWNLLDVEDQI